MAENPLIGRGWSFPILPDGSGGIAMADGTQDIEQASLLILSTSPGERVMRPNFGCRIHELVFAPLTGMIGTAQAAEALKLVAGCGESLSGRLLLLDGLAMEWRSIQLGKDPGCTVCGPAS